jgi:hypothetical protein
MYFNLETHLTANLVLNAYTPYRSLEDRHYPSIVAGRQVETIAAVSGSVGEKPDIVLEMIHYSLVINRPCRLLSYSHHSLMVRSCKLPSPCYFASC